jgi:hypothetical protein
MYRRGIPRPGGRRPGRAPVSLEVLYLREVRVAREIDWDLFEKACDITASALRGAMGGENSQPAGYAGEVFREVWSALKEAAGDLPGRPKPGF